jgi:hypothetical protein
MQRFVFSLQRVLSWRRTQTDMEGSVLQQLTSDLDKLTLAEVRGDLLRQKVEDGVRECAVVAASDLWALSAYRARLLRERTDLAKRKKECEKRMATQRERVCEAERRCRLLERVEQRRRSEWTHAFDREMDAQAGESYLARWNRNTSRPGETLERG